MLLSLAQACERAGFKAQTCYNWRGLLAAGEPLHPAARGFLAIIRQSGRRLYVEEGDLEIWIRERRGAVRGRPAPAELSEMLRACAVRLRQSGRVDAARVIEALAEGEP